MVLCECHLPSKGKFYEDGLETIVLRDITTAEEAMIFGSSTDAVINKVLSACVVEPANFNIDKLISADKAYLLMKLRIHSYGSFYNANHFCPHCDFLFEEEMNLDDIKINEVSDDIKVPLKLRLPMSQDIVQIKVLTEGDFKKIKNKAEKLSKTSKKPVGELEYILKLARMIIAINDDEVDIYQAEKYVRAMSSRDSAHINNALSTIKIGYEGHCEMECPNCKKSFSSPFIISSEFFRPSTTEVEWL